jgi:O-methyltransferase
MINLEKLVNDIKTASYEMVGKVVKDRVLKLDGDIAEVGVSIGNTAEVICKAKGARPLHLFDTFEGHPADYITKYDWGQSQGRHIANIEDVKNRLRDYPNVYFYKGIFPATSDPVKNRKFCFVHLDTDLYKSTYEALEFFAVRMVPGGVIMFDDTSGIPSVFMAIEDFCVTNKDLMDELLIPGEEGLSLMTYINKATMRFK